MNDNSVTEKDYVHAQSMMVARAEGIPLAIFNEDGTIDVWPDPEVERGHIFKTMEKYLEWKCSRDGQIVEMYQPGEGNDPTAYDDLLGRGTEEQLYP